MSNQKPKSSNWKKEWNSRKIILKPLIFFILIMGTFYGFWVTPFFQQNVLPHILNFNAFLGCIILNIFGFETTQMGSAISNSDFNVNVKAGCDGVEAIMLCVAGILVYPTKWKWKWIGLVGGVLFLFMLNLIRIISLFLTGIYWRPGFDFMHLDFWQVVFIILAILTVLFWIQWSNKKMTEENKIND